MSEASAAATTLKPWQVLLGGICSLVLTVGLARFAYTPLLPQMHAQAGLGLADGGLLAAINYAGYMSGALLVAWIESPHWRRRLYLIGLPLSLVITALMALGDGFWLWAVSRYFGGLCGAGGMLLGSGLVQGWLLRHGHRPELGVHFMGLGLGVAVAVMVAAPVAWRPVVKFPSPTPRLIATVPTSLAQRLVPTPRPLLASCPKSRSSILCCSWR
jgi:MFS family permease